MGGTLRYGVRGTLHTWMRLCSVTPCVSACGHAWPVHTSHGSAAANCHTPTPPNCPHLSPHTRTPGRAWLNKSAGGGPWGPMDDRYLLRAGRRLPEKQLLDHYHSHTERCSICRPALRNLRLTRAAAAAVGIAAAAVAAVSLFVQYVAPAAAAAPAAAGQAAARQVTAAAAAASSSGWPPLVALAAACAAVAAVAGLVWRWCHRTIPQFYTGERPFARNRVPGEFAPQI